VNGLSASWDDEELLTALQDAFRSRATVPADFIEAGKGAFAWHNIDAELAELTYDSLRSTEDALSMRAEAASIRALTFTSAHLTLELEIAEDRLLGQVVPAQSAEITVHRDDGGRQGLDADEIGRFSVQPVPSGPFRLRCRTADGAETLTGWIML
jgi:hypothetical protein